MLYTSVNNDSVSLKLLITMLYAPVNNSSISTIQAPVQPISVTFYCLQIDHELFAPKKHLNVKSTIFKSLTYDLI